MRCNVWIMTTRTWLTNKRTAHSRASVHVRCVDGVLGLGGHVVIGVVLGFTTQTQYPCWSRCHWCRARFQHADAITSTDFFPSGFCSSLVVLVVRLYSVIVNPSVAKLLHTFASRKRIIWGVVFTFFALKRFLDTKFIGLGFATAEPSLDVLSWAPLDMTLCFLFECRSARLRHASRSVWPMVMSS